MIVAVRQPPRLAPVETAPVIRRESRQSAEMALFGLYEISKILNAPVRLESMLASVVNILTSFLAMRRGMIVVIDEAGDPAVVAAAGWAGAAEGPPGLWRARPPRRRAVSAALQRRTLRSAGRGVR